MNIITKPIYGRYCSSSINILLAINMTKSIIIELYYSIATDHNIIYIDDAIGITIVLGTSSKMTEAEIIQGFLPDLVTAVSDSVQPVSDQCLAKGLISGNVHDQILESGGTSKDKARTLILAVKKSTETDSQCFQILLSILKQTLPYMIKNHLLPLIEARFTEKSSAMVPITVQSKLTATEILKECTIQQETYIGQFEESVRQHAYACSEKKLLNEKLEKQTKEIERLRKELGSQVRANESKNATTHERLSTCESEATEMKQRIEKLESIIEEQGMKVKRKRSAMMFGITELLSNQEREMSKRKEEESVPAITNKEESEKETQGEATSLSVSALEASLRAVEEQIKQEKAQQEQRLKDLEEKVVQQAKQLEVKQRQAKGEIQLPANYIPLNEPISSDCEYPNSASSI